MSVFAATVREAAGAHGRKDSGVAVATLIDTAVVAPPLLSLRITPMSLGRVTHCCTY